MSAGGAVVVGSINLDIAVRAPRIPGPGETLLAAAGVRTDPLDTVDVPTGTALISVDAVGENAIVVVPGANASVGEPTGDQRARIASADVVLAQLEIPLPAVIAAAGARATGTLFVLNAAPSALLSDALWALVDILVVNEHEAVDLADLVPGDRSNLGIHDPGARDVDRAIELLLHRVPVELVTLGSAGSVLPRRGSAPVQRLGAQDSEPTAAETRAQRDLAYPSADPAVADQEAEA